MMILRVLDLETTGLEPTDQIVEMAHYDVVDGFLDTYSGRSALVRPSVAIPPLSSAVHHITNFDVRDANTWLNVLPTITAKENDGEELKFVAHMASFERQWLDKHLKVDWICTWKCSLRQWPDLESFSLQAIRYQLALPVESALAMPPHRAAPDAYVCGMLLVELLKHQTVETLVQWTTEPPVFTKVDFGMHRGKLVTEVDGSYLDWLANKEHTMGDDWRWNAKRELDRRADIPRQKAAAARAAYVEMALAALPGAASVHDLNNWYLGQAEQFAKYGVLVGTEEHDILVAACGARKAILLEVGEPSFERTAVPS